MITCARLSFVVPARDERQSLPQLLHEIRAVARRLARDYEIVVVDDGSGDGTKRWLATQPDDVVPVFLDASKGQSGALAAGFERASGDVLITLDADLQNDPADAPALLESLRSFDLVCGVRRCRRDRISKRVGSRVANRVRRWVLKDHFRDTGCALRAMRRTVVDRLPKFPGFHRFVPVLADALGFRVTEIEVGHRPREHGRTHYGELGRAIRGTIDMFRVRRLIGRVRRDAS